MNVIKEAIIPNTNPITIHTIHEEDNTDAIGGANAGDTLSFVIGYDSDIKTETTAPETSGAHERTNSAPIVMIRAASSLCTTFNV